MQMRRVLLGLMGAGALCGVAAKPPGGPLSEGRELDPVTRDFHLAAPAVVPSGTAPPLVEKPRDLFGGSILAGLWEAILNELTMPLGTAPSDGAAK
jgi:hypothetical protein